MRSEAAIHHPFTIKKSCARLSFAMPNSRDLKRSRNPPAGDDKNERPSPEQ
jgi:hypothetical protein